MTAQDFQDKLDQIVTDLQTIAKGKTTQIALRGEDGNLSIFALSSDVNGVVDASQLQFINDFFADNQIFPTADDYETERAEITPLMENFRQARDVHNALFVAATNARNALNEALADDATYQAANTALEAARSDPDYIAAVNNYRNRNCVENFGNLTDARGKYF